MNFSLLAAFDERVNLCEHRGVNLSERYRLYRSLHFSASASADRGWNGGAADRFFQAAPVVLAVLKARVAANTMILATKGILWGPFCLTG